MFSTSAFSDDFCSNFGRLPTDSHIRVVPNNEDPRSQHDTAASEFQRLPEQSQDEFPPLDSTKASDASKITDSSGTYTYADVLKLSRTIAFDLGKFAPEIRELVWEAAMRADGSFSSSINLRTHVYRLEDAARPSFLPRVCSVSKSLRDETVAVFMRNSSFTIASIRDNSFLRRFVASVPEGRLHIRELNFRNFDFFPEHDRGSGEWNAENLDLELAVHCTGLRTVHLTIGPRFVSYYTYDDASHQYIQHFKSAEELVAKYRLRRLFDCEKLRTVHWHGLWMTDGHERLLRELAEWVKAEFASRGRMTKYTVG